MALIVYREGYSQFEESTNEVIVKPLKGMARLEEHDIIMCSLSNVI